MTDDVTPITKVDEVNDPHDITILQNRVPDVTIIFWIIKVLSTTTGETFADYLNETVGLGLPNTTYIMVSSLIVALAAEFYVSRYNAFIYWLVVVLISIVGTLVTDNITDGLGIELWISTVVFAILLIVAFGGWYWKEGTLNFKKIYTRRRECFYWVAVLLAFALGTAAGDLITEGWGLGYWGGTALFGGLIAIDLVAWLFLKANEVACFWTAYILTRPLGASIGDLLSQDPADGGLGVGTTITSCVFLAIIVVLVTYCYITVTRERASLEAIAEVQPEKPAVDTQHMQVDSEVP